jgi:hypothetical protein
VLVVAQECKRTPEIYGPASEASAEVVAFFREQIARQREHPRPGILSDLIAVRDQAGDRLSENELIVTCALLLVAVGGLLQWQMRRALTAEFDVSLVAMLNTMTMLVEQKRGHVSIDFTGANVHATKGLTAKLVSRIQPGTSIMKLTAAADDGESGEDAKTTRLRRSGRMREISWATKLPIEKPSKSTRGKSIASMKAMAS